MDKVEQVLSVAKRRGREAARTAIQLQCLLWLRDNQAVEFLPGASIGHWIMMHGSENVQAYIKDMQRPQTWVDTPIFWVVSAIYQVQFIVFLASGEGPKY